MASRPAAACTAAFTVAAADGRAVAEACGIAVTMGTAAERAEESNSVVGMSDAFWAARRWRSAAARVARYVATVGSALELMVTDQQGTAR